MECRRCGTCCTAPDIAALGKKLGEPCMHLDSSMHCKIYDSRPPVCRKYRPDELCDAIKASSLEERVDRYLTLFGLDRS